VLLEPCHEPTEAAEVRERCRYREECRGRGALELTAAHFATELAVDPAARHASIHMGFRTFRVAVARLSGRLSGNSAVAELAHATRRGDRRDSLKLGVGATNGRAHLAEREAEVTGGRYGTDPIGRHYGNDLALALVELGHKVSSAGKTVAQLQVVKRIGSSRAYVLNGRVELDALTRTEARGVTPFAVAMATVSDREPEGSQQVLLTGRAVWRHHDGRDRLIHDLLLRVERNPARLAAPTQLPDQVGATALQLVSRLLRRPPCKPMPRRADHARAPRPASTNDPA
jgi:hypothetical protein